MLAPGARAPLQLIGHSDSEMRCECGCEVDRLERREHCTLQGIEAADVGKAQTSKIHVTKARLVHSKGCDRTVSKRDPVGRSAREIQLIEDTIRENHVAKFSSTKVGPGQFAGGYGYGSYCSVIQVDGTHSGVADLDVSEGSPSKIE